VGERPFNTSELAKKARRAENGRFQPSYSRSEAFDDPKILERNGWFPIFMNPEFVNTLVASSQKRVGRKLNPSYEIRKVRFFLRQCDGHF
jgi:hypothetical protein